MSDNEERNDDQQQRVVIFPKPCTGLTIADDVTNKFCNVHFVGHGRVYYGMYKQGEEYAYTMLRVPFEKFEKMLMEAVIEGKRCYTLL